jgi:hypothetical protein
MKSVKSSVAVELPSPPKAEPEATPQSIAAAVVEEMKSDPAAQAALAAGERSATKRRAKATPIEIEVVPDPPKAAADDEPNTEATEGDEEEGTELQDRLADLAERYGMDAQDFADCESVEEAERVLDKLYRLYARDGRNGHAPAPSPIPAAATNGHPQTQVEEEDVDFGDLADDDVVPVAKAKKLVSGIKSLKAKFAAIEQQQRAWQEQQVQQSQAQAAREFQQSLRRKSEELFGTDQKQDARQQRREARAFEAVNTLIVGLQAQGRPVPSFDVLAERVMRMEFPDEVSKSQAQSRQKSIEQRAKSRIGSPERKANAPAQVSGKAYAGPPQSDPDLIAAVRAVQRQTA